MRRLVPEFILSNFAEGNFHGEFRAVVLFADITGFSTLTENLMSHGQHGAEVLAGMMRHVFEPMIAAVYQHCGFVPTLAGDAITALFPVAQSEPEAVLHALTCAWNMQGSISEQPPFKSAYGDFEITCRVGIALGQIEWAIITSEDDQRAAYYFRGPGIEKCSQVEKHAQPGQVVVDEVVHQYLVDTTVIESIERFFTISDLVGDLPASHPYSVKEMNLDHISRFFPTNLVQQSIDGEFRQVVNLFINLPTIRTRNQLRVFMRSLFQIQEKYGGLLNRLDFGDKGAHILLFWGAPKTYEDDVERALDFALTLQEGTSIPIHAGVTYQNSHAGFIGSSLREEYTCYGKGINLAARFMVAAPRGEIWVDQNIATRAKRHYLIDTLDQRVFKGFSSPQPVYLLQERKEKSAAIFQGEMVGRQAEFEQLTNFLQPLEENKFCGIMLIEGEAGIGKSRLVHEIQGHDQFSPGVVFWAHCQTKQYVREAFNPFRYWMRRYFEVSEMQGEARNKRSFNQHMDDLIFGTDDRQVVDELDRTRSFLGALLGLEWPDSLYAEAEAQDRYEKTLAGLAALLLAEASIQPVIVLLEDVHWLDADSQTFIAYLLSRLNADLSKSYPLAILATTRPSIIGEILGANSPHQEIILDQLGEVETMHLAEQVLDAPPNPELLQFLLERTSGNPFFIEQILRYMVEQEVLNEGEKGWEINLAETSLLPADVRAVLVARLDQLERKEKEVVHFASVLGHEFDLQILAHMLDGDPGLPDRISRCQQKGIWTALGENRYAFNHALMQDAAYHMQTHKQRARLHAAAAAAIKHHLSGELESHYGELAFHSENAGEFAQAYHFYQLAARRAAQNYANQEAIHNFSGAIKLSTKISPPQSEIASLYLQRGRVLELTGAFDQARADFESSLAIAHGADEHQITWQTFIDLGKLWASRDYQKTSEYFLQALSYARKSDDLLLVGSSLNWMGNWYANNEEPLKAISSHQEAMQIFQEAGEKQQLAQSLDFLGMAYMLAADLNSSTSCYSRAIQLYREMNDRPGLITSLMGRGANTSCQYMLTAIPSYQPSDSFQDYAEAIQLAQEIGSPLLENGPYWVLGILNIIQGDFHQAYEIIQRGYQLSKEIQHREWHVSNLYAMGVYYCELLDPDTALPYLEEALNLAQDLQSRVWVHWVTSALAKACILQNDIESAHGYLEKVISPQSPMDTLGRRCCWAQLARVALAKKEFQHALEITERLIETAPGMGENQVITYLWLLKAETLAEAGDIDKSLSLLEQAKENARISGEVFLLWRVRLVLAELLRGAGKHLEVENELRAARNLIHKLGETIDDQALKIRFLARTENRYNLAF